MEAILERCAGLDVHQENVVACLLYDELERNRSKKSVLFQQLQKDYWHSMIGSVVGNALTLP
ncbi:hypothetical protein [Paenibacillus sp. URB8-2]|uniref:hypothetical protein n=1 Tax=Paenibacillus sp. URB8-2 TaxID=2741301 RepID=UPI0015C1E55B|nr:hypothetical protein [Paenibacillus sp. URB8-2]BCG57780.1 hypothetical protein PUR_12050 [Paenibacillus sp. URB8-2]